MCEAGEIDSALGGVWDRSCKAGYAMAEASGGGTQNTQASDRCGLQALLRREGGQGGQGGSARAQACGREGQCHQEARLEQ